METNDRSNVAAADFEQWVVEALDGLPDFVKEHLNNVEVVVADWPSPQELRAVGLNHRWQLLGLYQGVPLTRRTSGYNLVPPDKITLFRCPIERICPTPEAVRQQVRKTVIHELAHHFGISDARLKALGAY